MEIVEKVKLSEKEVQIWFQNKRQSSRRKSRPLLPHEIAAFGLGGMAALSSDPVSSSSYGGSQPMSPGAHLRSDVSVIGPPDNTAEKESDSLQKDKQLCKSEEATTPTGEMERIPSYPPQPLHNISGLEGSLDTEEQQSNAVDGTLKSLESLPGTHLSQHHLDNSLSVLSSSQAPIIDLSTSKYV